MIVSIFYPLLLYIQSHYSVTKGMFFMGLGMDNMVRVKTDSVGRMIPEELDKEIKQAKSQVGFSYKIPNLHKPYTRQVLVILYSIRKH